MEPWAGLLIAIGIVAAVWLALVAVLWLHRPSRDLVVPALRLVPDLVRLVRRLIADPRSPRRVRVVLTGLLLWLLSPIDLVPEFLPVIGSLDDIVVAALALRWVARHVDPGLLHELWPGTPESYALLLRLLRTTEHRTPHP